MRVDAVRAPPAGAVSSDALRSDPPNAFAVSFSGFFPEAEAGAAEAVDAVVRPSAATQATARPPTARDRPGRCCMNQLLIDDDAGPRIMSWLKLKLDALSRESALKGRARSNVPTARRAPVTRT